MMQSLSYLLEMSSITTPSQKTISNIHTRYIFQRDFKENICDFTELHYGKSNLEVTCKRDHFGYWNLCKRLPNCVNMAALMLGLITSTAVCVPDHLAHLVVS